MKRAEAHPLPFGEFDQARIFDLNRRATVVDLEWVLGDDWEISKQYLLYRPNVKTLVRVV